MATRISGLKLVLAMMVLSLLLVLGGCAKYQARSAFEEAEELAKAEQFDQAVEKYFAATQDDPTNKTYKLKLIAGRTRAAAYHINRARNLVKEEKFEQALAEYRLARGFDPSVEVAALEARQVEEIVAARQKLDQALKAFQEQRYPVARQIVGEILKVDPQNARAGELLKMLDAKHGAVVMDGIELEVTSSEPITLHFKQANVKEVFGIISQLSGINFLLDDEIKEKPVTILLEKATFSQAMELILQMAGLGKKVLNSKTMIIYTQNKDKEKQYEDQIIQTFFLSHIDAKKAVNLLRTMLQLRKVYVHEERNAIVVRDKPATIKLAEQVLLAADRENSEVLFDLELLAVSNTDALQFGPRLSQYGTKVGFSTISLGTDNQISVIPDNTITNSLSDLQTLYTVPSATFDFAKTLTDSEILASPKIRVRNNEKAKVHIGTREPVITVTTTGDTSTDNIQYVDVGVKVDVEPTIQLDQSVQTKLTLEVSQVIDRFETNNGSVALTISTTNAQSVLTLKDGVQTIIGGLFEQDRKNTKTGFAFLSDIPLLGDLLSNFDKSDTKREILLSITPYIVKQIEVPETEVATIWSGGEDDLMARPKFGAFARPLLSEVEEVTPAAAPALSRGMRPEPSTALQGRLSAIPGKTEAVPAEPSLPTAEAASTQPSGAPDAVPSQPPAPAVEPPAVVPGEPVTPPLAPEGKVPGAAAPPAPADIGVTAPTVAPSPPGPAVPSSPPPVTPPQLAPPTPPPVAEGQGAVTPGPGESTTPVPAAPAPATEATVVPPAPVAPGPAEPAAVEAVPVAGGEPAPFILPLPPKRPAQLTLAGPGSAAPGQEVAVAVEVSGVEMLYSAPLFVNYDPALLEFVDAQEGPFLGQSGQTTVFSYSPNAAAGQVVVGNKQGTGGGGASGSGTLFLLRFRGKAPGTAKVELNRINFRDPAGKRLAVEPAVTDIIIR